MNRNMKQGRDTMWRGWKEERVQTIARVKDSDD
jgi:hypothetical protein